MKEPNPMDSHFDPPCWIYFPNGYAIHLHEIFDGYAFYQLWPPGVDRQTSWSDLYQMRLERFLDEVQKSGGEGLMKLKKGDQVFVVPRYGFRWGEGRNHVVAKAGCKLATLDNGKRIDLETLEFEFQNQRDFAFRSEAEWIERKNKEVLWRSLRTYMNYHHNPPDEYDSHDLIKAHMVLGIRIPDEYDKQPRAR